MFKVRFLFDTRLLFNWKERACEPAATIESEGSDREMSYFVLFEISILKLSEAEVVGGVGAITKR